MTAAKKSNKIMSSQHSPKIPTQGARGTGLPPIDPTTAQMTTVSQGTMHTLSTIRVQIPHANADDTNRTNTCPWVITHPLYLVTTQADPLTDDDELQRSPTLRLGAGKRGHDRRVLQEDTNERHQPTKPPTDLEMIRLQHLQHAEPGNNTGHSQRCYRPTQNPVPSHW